MSKQVSSMFLSNVTLIDAAYLSTSGFPVGISVSPVFEIRGSLDDTEQVVIDFSKCKKLLKEAIDHRDTGYDHKLWVDPAFWYKNIRQKGDRVEITTPYMHLSVPDNAICFAPTADLSADDTSQRAMLSSVADAMSQYLTGYLSQFYSVEVFVHLPAPAPSDTRSLYLPDTAYRISFAYTHGLPFSSSWGCQNIVHGHSSFIDVLAPSSQDAKDLCATIWAGLDNHYFYDVTHHKGSGLHEYETERGLFSLQLSFNVPEISMRCAPTIENIVEYVATRWASELEAVGATVLAVSEGTWKGALIRCPDANWTSR